MFSRFFGLLKPVKQLLFAGLHRHLLIPTAVGLRVWGWESSQLALEDLRSQEISEMEAEAKLESRFLEIVGNI